MKKVLLISVVLAFLSAPPPANAYAIENIVITETGGASAQRVHAEGSSEASASVESHIRTEDSSTRVRVDVRKAEDGIVSERSSERVIEGSDSVDVRILSDAESSFSATATATATATNTPPSRLLRIFGEFRVSLERIIKLVFFFW